MSSKSRSSSARDRKKPPPNKKKKPSPATEQPSIISLPHDLLLNCIARISRLYYPTLSLVCKNFRSIVSSPELYETRSRLNRTEKCLYVSLHFSFDTSSHWLTLSRLPDRNITGGSSGYFMNQVPSPNHLLPAQTSTLVAVGSDIYKIGGADYFDLKLWKRPYSPEVSVLDCRTHKWRNAPSMKVKRNSSATASLVDGKIYVAGGCKERYLQSPDWIEVFDVKTQTWESVKNPLVFHLHEEFRDKAYTVKILEFEGKLYLRGDDFEVYDPVQGKWNSIDYRMKNFSLFWAVWSSHCVIDNVIFFWDRGVIRWYDFESNSGKVVNGIEGLPDLLKEREYCKMVDLGGKMGLMWDEDLFTNHLGKRIWCAEIGFEKRDGDEMWGKVEWIDFVLRAHHSCTYFDAVSVSL